MRLAVRLLGGVEVILDGERLRAFDSLRLQRFLALIALRRDAQHRSRLAFELWPDSDESQARTNLRKLLHEFRHALPDVEQFVDIEKETVLWISTGPSEVDVQQFRDAVAAGNLHLASQIYSGDFLPACYDDWVLEDRAKLRAEVYGALVRLTEEAAERNDHKATVRHARRIIDLEPTDEAAVRFQMEAHVALGDRAAALRAYHRYAMLLRGDGDLSGAIANWEKAIEYDPLGGVYYYWMGRAYEKRGKEEKGKQLKALAAEISPDDPFLDLEAIKKEYEE